MTEFRIWHPSRDPYHCAFRMVRLLAAQSDSVPIERLRILDMLLLYPALLHKISMTSDLRRQLRELELARPERFFVRLPSMASVWQDLQAYQLAALKHLAGRGLLQREALLNQRANLENSQVPQEILLRAITTNEEQVALISFLTKGLAEFPDAGKEGLAHRAHLPARGPVL